jgi:hypothetical protein
MPGFIEAILPVPANGSFNERNLEIAAIAFTNLNNNPGVDVAVARLDLGQLRQELDYAQRLVAALRNFQQHRNGVGRRDHLATVLRHIDAFIAAATRRIEQNEANSVPYNSIFKAILYHGQQDTLRHFYLKYSGSSNPDAFARLIKTNYRDTGLQRIILRHLADARRDDIHLQRLMANILPDPVQQHMLDMIINNLHVGVARPLAPMSIIEANTHAASIHKDASESATRLRRAFGAGLNHEKLPDFELFFNNLELMQNLLRLVTAELKFDEPVPNLEKLRTSIRKALSFALAQKDFKDPVSQVSLGELIRLVLRAINIEFNGDQTKRYDAYMQLCKALYLLQEEYANLGGGASCAPGFFNGILYSQLSTLPRYISIRIQDKTHAAAAMGDKITLKASELLRSEVFTNAAAFITRFEALVADPQFSIDLMRTIVTDFHLVFDYNSPETAAAACRDIATLNRHSQELCGCNADQIFTTFPPNLEQMYGDFVRSKVGAGVKADANSSSGASEAKPRPAR